jgi:FlaA1/EpsC-like NDP-sugar epimerase
MESFYGGKRILVTGAAGTVGSELVRHLIAMGPEEVRLVDNNETGMFFLMEEHRNKSVYCFLGDVRDYEKLEKLAAGMDIVIHAAAFKHVILSEYNPFDVVQTNIYGVENVIRAANATGVSHVLFTSSDKAVNPTNVMGTSKLMGRGSGRPGAEIPFHCQGRRSICNKDACSAHYRPCRGHDQPSGREIWF